MDKEALLGVWFPFSEFGGPMNKFSFVLIFAFGLGLAHAQEDEQLSLDELLSVKLSTGSFLELDMTRSPLSMTIIDKEKIHHSGARHLSELLEIYVPGFQYMYNKWNGIIWGMRGVAADRNTKILFLVNGHKMNMESRDGAMSEISLGLLSDIERVEVLRGPAGLVYGSGAIGGIVNVVTSRHLDQESFDRASVTLGTWDLGTTSTEVNGTVHSRTDDGTLTVDFGYRNSEGVGQERARIYGKAHWPYPFWLENPPQNGALSDGSALSTPGNYKVGMNWEHKGFRLYTRFTHQVDNAGGLFVLDPWPEVRGAPNAGETRYGLDTISRRAVQAGTESRPSEGFVLSTEATTVREIVGDDTVRIHSDTNEIWMTPVPNSEERTTSMVDGQAVSNDSWYASTESGDLNRRQYVIDNVFAELSYGFDFGENQLRLKGSLDGVTNRTQLENRRGYESLAASERSRNIGETFGERRFTLNGTYLWNSVARLQLATGYEWRLDKIGDDLAGTNSQSEKANHLVVSDITYYNHALFVEGIYNIFPQLDFHGGVRWDGHTRTIEQRDEVFRMPGILSPKASLLYYPMVGHSIKAIFQSSANNGSADNYEYNRNSMDDDGNAFTTYHFPGLYEYPDQNSVPIPGVTEEELHKLKPERTWSLELATQHRLLHDRFALSTSMTYNTISNLFAWNQAKFRVVNAGEYHFVTAELEASYSYQRWSIGASHAYQRLVNTDVESQEEVAMGPSFDRTKDWFDTLYDSRGRAYYVPDPTSYNDTVRFNAVKDQISVDGKDFLNLVPHLSKVYLDWEFLPNVVFHTDMRIFWGLWGREDIYNYTQTTVVTGSKTTFDTTYVVQPDESVVREIDTITTEITSSSSNYSYLDDRGYSDNTIFNALGIENSPMVKWNISLHWSPRTDLRISAFVYDVLGEDNGSASGNDLAIHTLRWQQSGNSREQTDLFGTDLRSYALRIEKTF